MSCSLPLPPPPPAPAALAAKIKLASNFNKSTIANQIDECLWAQQLPELQKACFLARVCSAAPPQSCQYRNIAGILQQGPTCGLTAVSMLMDGSIETTKKLLKNAQQQNYSINGEMFSAFNLFQLISNELRQANMHGSVKENCANKCATPANNSEQMHCELFEGQLDCEKVRNQLRNGCCMLVPYDPDYNHAPSLKYGHKAHWALIVGFLLTNQNEFYVLARHGKTKNLAVWSLSALSESNANLIEFSQPKGYPDCEFQLPPGGIGGKLGLKKRAIIVKGLPHETTIVC